MGIKESGGVVVVDGGGRGSALVDAYSRSSHVKRVLAVPGNDLMQSVSEKPVEIFPRLKTTDVSEIIDICKQEHVDLVDVAQDNAVEAGLVDALMQKGIPVVGPTRKAGEIEWSKTYARKLGKQIGLPQPEFGVFTTMTEGIEYVLEQPDYKNWFVKADGLAEGKGVTPIENKNEVEARIRELQRKFPAPASTYLIEDWIGREQEPYETGEEFSYFVITDGKVFKKLGVAQDQKRLFDKDEGPNTGGMGSTSPPYLVNEEISSQTEKKIIKPVFEDFKQLGITYKGILYLGAIYLPNRRKVYIIEFNARWGDPEAQVILPGLQTDLFELGQSVVNQDLNGIEIKTDGKYRVAIAGVSVGYPGDYSDVVGKEIWGIDQVMKTDGIKFYGAGIKKEGRKYYVSGGRLFYIVGEGKNPIEARERAYGAMAEVGVEGNNLHFRTDTAWRDVERFRKMNNPS